MTADSVPGRRVLLRAGGAAAASLLVPRPSLADEAYPSRPVKLIVPFLPGGPVDLTGRAIAQRVSEQWGQQMVVDNRAGAGGIVGAEVAARSRPDGYTVFMCSIHHSVLPAMKPSLSYDITRDFVPVSFGAMFPIILVVHPSLPVKNVRELIALAKASPGKLAYSSAGNGGGTHLAGELFKSLAGVDITHVPYKGSAPAMSDLLGGQVQMTFADAPTAMGQMPSGKVRAIAVGSPQRSALAPDLPTFVESGVAGYDAYSWAAMVAPAGTPAAIVERLNREVVAALNEPTVRERLLRNGAEAMPTTPARFGEMLRSEMAKWGKVVKAANIQAD